MVRVFANCLGDVGSIPGRVIPKTQKWYLMRPCLTLSIIRYGSRVKWSNPGKGVAPSPTPWCSSYWKGNLQVTLDYDMIMIYIYIYIYIGWNDKIVVLKKTIIIIMSYRQHGYPWPSLATSPNHSSPPAGLQGYILCPHIVAVCKFELVVLLLHGHMWVSIGVHHLWENFYWKNQFR